MIAGSPYVGPTKYPLYERASDDVLIICGSKFDTIRALTQRPWRAVPGTQSLQDAKKPLLEWLRLLGIDGPEGKKSKPLLWDSFRGLMVADHFPKLLTNQASLFNLSWNDPNRTWRAATSADKALFDAWATREQEGDGVTVGAAITDEVRVIRQLVDRLAREEKLFKTTEGRIGLCPPWVEAGDALLYVVGSRWPVILRERLGTDDAVLQSTTYELVGTCYVRGITIDRVSVALRQAEKIHVC